MMRLPLAVAMLLQRWSAPGDDALIDDAPVYSLPDDAMAAVQDSLPDDDAPVYMSFLQRDTNTSAAAAYRGPPRNFTGKAHGPPLNFTATARPPRNFSVTALLNVTGRANSTSAASFWRGSGRRAAPRLGPKHLFSGAAAAPQANTSVDALLELSEQVLEQTSQLLPLSLPERVAAAAMNGTGAHRAKEEQTLAALADHSGQLERLFHQLADEMESTDGQDEESKEARAMLPPSDEAAKLAAAAGEAVEEAEAGEADAGSLAEAAGDVQAAGDRVLHLFSEDAPEAHQYAEAGIGDTDQHAHAPLVLHARGKGVPVEPSLASAFGKQPEMRRDEAIAPAPAGRGHIGTGLLLAFMLAAGTVGYCMHARLLDGGLDGKAASASEEQTDASPRVRAVEPREGKTSYVIRVVRVRIEGLSAQALAWQLQVAEQQPRPSRFATTWVWDAPVDRLDVDVDNPTETIAFAILEQSAALMDPPRTVATVEIPAGVLLAEARRNVEKVKSSRQADQYVHEKRLAIPGGGCLIVEYSLIAFFHWYVGGAEHSVRP